MVVCPANSVLLWVPEMPLIFSLGFFSCFYNCSCKCHIRVRSKTRSSLRFFKIIFLIYTFLNIYKLWKYNKCQKIPLELLENSLTCWLMIPFLGLEILPEKMRNLSPIILNVIYYSITSSSPCVTDLLSLLLHPPL